MSRKRKTIQRKAKRTLGYVAGKVVDAAIPFVAITVLSKLLHGAPAVAAPALKGLGAYNTSSWQYRNWYYNIYLPWLRQRQALLQRDAMCRQSGGYPGENETGEWSCTSRPPWTGERRPCKEGYEVAQNKCCPNSLCAAVQVLGCDPVGTYAAWAMDNCALQARQDGCPNGYFRTKNASAGPNAKPYCAVGPDHPDGNTCRSRGGRWASNAFRYVGAGSGYDCACPVGTDWFRVSPGGPLDCRLPQLNPLQLGMEGLGFLLPGPWDDLLILNAIRGEGDA